MQGANRAKRVLVPATLGGMANGVMEHLAELGYDPIPLESITSEDIDCGLAHIDNDVCFPTIATVGQYLRYLAEHDAGDGMHVLAAELCKGCRSAALSDFLPSVFRRAGLGNVGLVNLDNDELKRFAPCAARIENPRGNVAIGLCGNTPAFTIDAIHRAVIGQIAKSGCRAVFPPLQAVVGERHFLLPAFDFFRERGIADVICVLPFGCMGGQVYARGQLRTMQKRYPEIELTVLDFDSSASEVNLVNRTELVVQRALERSRARKTHG